MKMRTLLLTIMLRVAVPQHDPKSKIVYHFSVPQSYRGTEPIVIHGTRTLC
jgi:hypothetical protein